MKNFEDFVKHIVSKWRVEKTTLLSEHGLAGLANRTYGDKAEEYIKRKVEALTPSYTTFISPGSQTPADIMAVARRNSYWHIMLIQVKSSDSENSIYQLTEKDRKVLNQFAQFVKKETGVFEGFKTYVGKSIVVSTGYAAVRRIEKPSLKHFLVNTEAYNHYRQNTSQLDLEGMKEAVAKAHRLGKA